MDRSKIAEEYEIKNGEEYTHSIAFLEGMIDKLGEVDSEYKLNELPLYEPQNIVAHWCMQSRNIVYSAPSASGKTWLSLWASVVAIQNHVSFAYVVRDEFRKTLMHNELKRIGCQRICVADTNIDTRFGLLITIQKLRELIGEEKIQSIKVFIFDDMDQMLDKDYGHLWEEALVELRQTSRYIFTATNFSNIDYFARWIATIYQTPCHFVRVKKRPFKFNFNISIPQDKNSMQIFRLSEDQNEFAIDEEVFKNAMQEFYTPKNESDMAEFVEKCSTTFPVRLTVQKLFNEQQSAVVVVVFDDNNSIMYANHLQEMTQISATSMANVNQILQEFHGRLDSTSEEFEFFLKITPMFLKGVAYMNKNMPPIIREMVETLFYRKLLIVLVITEEIAINSLVRTQRIVISSCRKFDGNAYNYLTNYEWQRLLCFKPNPRNSSQVPEVTLILDWKMSQETLEQIVLPQPIKLHTSMLNRTEEQLQNDESGLSFYRFLKMLEKERAAIEASEVATRLSEMDESQFNTNIRDFIKLETEIDELKKQIDAKSFIPSKIINYLSCGRLIKVIDGEKDFGVGIVITYEPSFDECPENGSLFVALKIARDSSRNVHNFRLLSPAHKDELIPLKEDDLPSAPIKIVKIPLEFVKVVFASRIKLPSSLRDKKELNFLYTLLNNLRKYRLKKVRVDDPELNVLHQKLEKLKEERDAKPVQHREGFEAEKQQLKEFYILGEQAAKTQKIKEEYNTIPFLMN